MSKAIGNETGVTVNTVDKPSLPTRTQANWVVVLLIVLCIGIASITVTLVTESAPSQIQKWEYKIVSPSDLVFEVEINKLGVEGWELVSARRATSSSEYDTTASYEMIFKRPLSANSEPSEK